jgi:hypothetical protein
VQELDLSARKSTFVAFLQSFLRGLGHGGVVAEPDSPVTLDDHYIPYLGPRRLRASGSASDHCRLIVAYVLALAETSVEKSGLHPGFTLLDEPFQQNPDDPHRDLFISFLASTLAQTLRYQTLVFTFLRPAEIDRLKEAGVRLILPADEHFLRRIPGPARPPS